MKRAEVGKGKASWVALVLEPDGIHFERHHFPTHAAALAHALAEVGLAPEDPGAWRCPMRATDPITTRHPRDDGWRCGHEAGHAGSHTLYSTEGESVLYPGRWVHPAEVGFTEKNTEKEN